MKYLICAIISVALFLPILRIDFVFKKENKKLSRYMITFISILAASGSFLCMYMGYLLYIVFKSPSLIVFGHISVLLCGIYFLFEYKRKHEYAIGFDTSFYTEEHILHKKYLDNPKTIPINFNNLLDLKGCFIISSSLIINSFFSLFCAALMQADVCLTSLFIFTISMIFFNLYELFRKFNFYKNIIKYEYFIMGILLIAVSFL